MSTAIKDPYVRIASAMLAWAAKDARPKENGQLGDDAAACWLLDNQAAEYIEIVGTVSRDAIESKIREWFWSKL